jgi:hypothetical protein
MKHRHLWLKGIVVYVCEICGATRNIEDSEGGEPE